jgi:hypothetical protein
MTQTAQFDGVSVVKKANVYFDGKCVSHSIVLADGTKKSVGVILPSTLTFNTGVPRSWKACAAAAGSPEGRNRVEELRCR